MHRVSSATLAVGLCWLCGCTENNPVATYETGTGRDGAGEGQASRDGLPPTDGVFPAADGYSCKPSTFISCKTASQLLQCDLTGTGTVIIDCPSGCANGACTGCTPQPFYLDGDNDGYGTPGAKVSACLKPNGYVANNLDCDDLDPAAHPGQLGWFHLPTKGTQSFDYDCSKLEERELPSLVSCAVAGMNCVGDGWVGAVPACGGNGTWAKCNKQGGMPPGCGTTTSNKLQGCH